MQMTRLEEHPTTTGTLVRWVPTQASLEAIAATEPTTRRGSYMQETHLGLRRAMERDGRSDASWIGIAFDMASPLDTDQMSWTLGQLARRHGVFRGWFTIDGENYRWHELGLGQLEFEMEVVGHAETEADVQAFVLEELTRACTPFDTIGWLLCGVLGEDKSVLYLGQDHIYTDGFSVVLLFDELVRLQKGLADIETMVPVGHYLDYAEAEREYAAEANIDHPAVQKWVEFALADPSGSTPRFPMDTGIAVGEKTPLGPYRLDLVDNDQGTELEIYATSVGATYPSLIHAALAIAARDLAGKSTHRFLNPVHSRVGEEWWLAMGWFINVVPVACAVGPEDTLDDVAVRMRESLRDCRVASELPAVRVMEIVQEIFGFEAEGTGRPPIFSYLDGRILPGQEMWDEHRFHGLTGAGEHDDVNVWINRMPTETYVVCAVPDTPQAMKAVDEYFTYARDLLHALI